MVKCKKLEGSDPDLNDVEFRHLPRWNEKNNKNFKILDVQAEVRTHYLRNTL